MRRGHTSCSFTDPSIFVSLSQSTWPRRSITSSWTLFFTSAPKPNQQKNLAFEEGPQHHVPIQF
ncbi:unnamed protein product [Tenebrio molitor]|nr:unnamed protein product [Tenebrio molitor]